MKINENVSYRANKEPVQAPVQKRQAAAGGGVGTSAPTRNVPPPSSTLQAASSIAELKGGASNELTKNDFTAKDLKTINDSLQKLNQLIDRAPRKLGSIIIEQMNGTRQQQKFDQQSQAQAAHAHLIGEAKNIRNSAIVGIVSSSISGASAIAAGSLMAMGGATSATGALKGGAQNGATGKFAAMVKIGDATVQIAAQAGKVGDSVGNIVGSGSKFADANAKLDAAAAQLKNVERDEVKSANKAAEDTVQSLIRAIKDLQEAQIEAKRVKG